jgi:hypothetical protein
LSAFIVPLWRPWNDLLEQMRRCDLHCRVATPRALQSGVTGRE